MMMLYTAHLQLVCCWPKLVPRTGAADHDDYTADHAVNLETVPAGYETAANGAAFHTTLLAGMPINEGLVDVAAAEAQEPINGLVNVAAAAAQEPINGLVNVAAAEAQEPINGLVNVAAAEAQEPINGLVNVAAAEAQEPINGLVNVAAAEAQEPGSLLPCHPALPLTSGVHQPVSGDFAGLCCADAPVSAVTEGGTNGQLDAETDEPASIACDDKNFATAGTPDSKQSTGSMPQVECADGPYSTCQDSPHHMSTHDEAAVHEDKDGMPAAMEHEAFNDCKQARQVSRPSTQSNTSDSSDQVAHTVWSPFSLPNNNPVHWQSSAGNGVEDDQCCYDMSFTSSDFIGDRQDDDDAQLNLVLQSASGCEDEPPHQNAPEVGHVLHTSSPQYQAADNVDVGHDHDIDDIVTLDMVRAPYEADHDSPPDGRQGALLGTPQQQNFIINNSAADVVVAGTQEPGDLLTCHPALPLSIGAQQSSLGDMVVSLSSSTFKVSLQEEVLLEQVAYEHPPGIYGDFSSSLEVLGAIGADSNSHAEPDGDANQPAAIACIYDQNAPDMPGSQQSTDSKQQVQCVYSSYSTCQESPHPVTHEAAVHQHKVDLMMNCTHAQVADNEQCMDTYSPATELDAAADSFCLCVLQAEDSFTSFLGHMFLDDDMDHEASQPGETIDINTTLDQTVVPAAHSPGDMDIHPVEEHAAVPRLWQAWSSSSPTDQCEQQFAVEDMGFSAMEFDMESDMPHMTDPSHASSPEARMSDANDVPDSLDQVAHALWSPLDKAPLHCTLTVSDSLEDDQLCYNMFNTTDAAADGQGDDNDVELPEMPDELVDLCVAAMAADAQKMNLLHQSSDCSQVVGGALLVGMHMMAWTLMPVVIPPMFSWAAAQSAVLVIVTST
eukprot:jgi/Chrzof1/431/Cz01g15190.t1